ncbi:MAG: hypothetical protein HY980_00595 [Candidatus Magasanikbacteria bacterium]|nr:hypothetical protein [Candidatus Magasanikbacteria bacterium]
MVLIGLDKTSYLSVAGALIANGTAEAPIVFTSALDTNYVQTNLTGLAGSAGPGDWSGIQIEPGGNFTGSFVKFLYGGKTFKKSPGAMFTTRFHSNVIYNYGGVVSLDNAEFSDSYFDFSSDNEPYSALIWVEAPLGYDASLTISNSNFNGGWRALKSFRQENGQTIEITLTDNTFRDFQSPDGLVISRRDFVNLSDSVFENNASDAVGVETWTLSQDYTLGSNVQYAFNSIFVPSGVVLTIDPGVRIKLAKYGSINVEGSIQANGTSEQPIIIESQNPNGKWGYIKFKNSNSVFNYANFVGGNLTSGMDVNASGALMAENSTLNLNNVNILNSRPPGNAIYSLNSNLNITNSVIGHSEEPNFDTAGIRAEGGAVILDNVTLQNLKFGIRGDFDDSGLLPHLELNNVTDTNFINVDYLWEPNTWLSPAE